MSEIEDKMTEAGFDRQRVKEAQVLYVLALSVFFEKVGFVDKLVGCFADGQSDTDLVALAQTACRISVLISKRLRGTKIENFKICSP